MSQTVAPWLEGLSEDFIVPTGQCENIHPPAPSSATHDANSLRSGDSRIPRRSLSGSASGTKTSSRASTAIRRSPLAPLNGNDSNSVRRPAATGTTKPAGTRSVSSASEGSVLRYGTVEQRSKSASPVKHQETLEWKRRLVRGQLGYGDQTDLFGPSGLENIFAKSRGASGQAQAPKNRMRWVGRSDDVMPSSPPPWPSSIENTRHEEQAADASDAGDIEERDESDQTFEKDDDVGFHDRRRSDTEEQPQEQPSSDDTNPYVAENDSDDDYQGTPSPRRSYSIRQSNDRTISGQSELHSGEGFSPVFVSKQTTIDGRVNYAAVDSHLVKQFQDLDAKLEQSPPDVVEESDLPDRSAFTDGPENESLPHPDLSLSENLPTGTPPVANLGHFVEMRRGAPSLGSFMQKPLSPSPSSAIEPAASGHDSDMLQLPTAPTPPRAPTTPARPRTPSPDKTRSSGSPLKLFGNHDTFTNNRLLRRMSQLDPELDGIRDDQVKRHRSAKKSGHSSNDYQNRYISAESAFGNGSLDEQPFSADVTFEVHSPSSESASTNGSPRSDAAPPGSILLFQADEQSSPEPIDTFRLKRKLSKQSAAKTSAASTLHSSVRKAQDAAIQNLDVEHAGKMMDGFVEGKRPPTSPFKNPTPKRRRTLHASELEGTEPGSVCISHTQMQEVLSSRKRKDARPSETADVADPDVLAQRNILRPRNPTPSQQRKQQISIEIRKATEEFISEPARLEAVTEQIESSMVSEGSFNVERQAMQVAVEVAKFTLRRPVSGGGERKKSVTTQDFINEAQMVMNYIRAKGRPQSGLGSVEESDGETAFGKSGQSLQPDNALQRGPSPLRLSRPPSREGAGSGWRPRSQPETDARKASFLRNFAENDDLDFIEETLHTLHVHESLEDLVEDAEPRAVVLDEQTKIRITGPPSERSRTRGNSDASQPSQGTSMGTQSSQQSAGESTGRTLGTSSTRKSENVGTLAPETVAHLIGEQVGGMTFDKEKQRWVRAKASNRRSELFLEPPSTLTSDDDPFREISDLPIDEVKEQNMSRPTSKGKLAANDIEHTSVHDKARESAANMPPPESRTTSEETVVARPSTSGTTFVHHAHSSSIPSRCTAFASSERQHVETRATSWSDEELAHFAELGKQREQPLAYAAAQALLAERDDQFTPHKAAEQSRFRESITFPSPPTRQIPPSLDTLEDVQGTKSRTDDYGEEAREDTEELDLDDTEVEDLPSPRRQETPQRNSSVYRGAVRQMSLRRKTFTNKFSAEMHEQSELSFLAPLPGERMMSLSVSVSGPVAARQRHPTDIEALPSSPTKNDETFYLSDLRDFTINDIEEQRPSEKALAQRLVQHAMAEVDDRYALAVKDLVRALTDVKADDPYWEDVKQLDLHNRSLVSLYGLDDFCTSVQDMDVSGNTLAQLDGAPYCVRSLCARSNQLTSLTAWGHLFNLQYLDISDNQLDSLHGLGQLMHLRELQADDNQIESLEGVMQLDGLLKLRLRRNRMKRVDFEDCQLQRLTSLDMSDNGISSVRNLQCLPALETLIVDGNELDAQPGTLRTLPKLSSLSLAHCRLQALSVEGFPALRKLDVDDNKLSTIDGISGLTSLEKLSMRRQALPDGREMAIFQHHFEARSLDLSGSSFANLDLEHTLLSLQHLELASSGLQDLPDDFGTRMPNLKTLNINFNSIKDIRPLLNIQRLEQLHACGNRLSRLRKSVATLAKMEGLRLLDLRDNPVTQGFYAPIAVRTMRENSLITLKVQVDDHDRGEVDAQLFEAQRHTLFPGDRDQDNEYVARLDEATKLRRRVYEMLLANSCESLDSVDGLHFEKQRALIKDSTWDRLVSLGIVRKSGTVTSGEE